MDYDKSKPPSQDLSGQRFGKLVVEEFLGRKTYPSKNRRYLRPMWLCRCDCGTKKEVVQGNLLKGNSTSCSIHCAFRRELVGTVFGRLTVIADDGVQVHGTQMKLFWLCECECGGSISVPQALLLSGNIKSCGCMRSAGRTNHRWGGVGDISGDHYSCLCRGASIRGIEVDITLKRLWELFQKQSGLCALTGVPLRFGTKKVEHGGGPGGERETTASADRINSQRGYVEGNVQWVHKDVNVMKMDMSQEEFIEWCYKVVSHQESLKREEQ